MSTVIREQHDTGQIAITEGDIETRLMSNAGGWDAYEMGITQEEARVQVRAATTPQARQQVIADLRERAIKRAGLDTSNGRVNMFAAGELPWHGLGVQVNEAATSADAIKHAGLDWTVSKRPLCYAVNKGGMVPDYTAIGDAFGIVRDDTNAALGTVGTRYKPIQNIDAFKFLDGVLADFGARYESAGSIYGGKRVWMLAHMPKQAFAINGGDEIKPYVLFSNCHDGTGAAWCFPTTVRVVCANTFRMAQRSRKGFYIRHDGTVDRKLAAAREALGLAVSSFQKFQKDATILYHKRMPDVTPYANAILDKIMSVTQADVKVGAMEVAERLGLDSFATQIEARRVERRIEQRQECLDDIVSRFKGERCNFGNMGGTAWAGFNAFTEHADFFTRPREASSKEVRLSRRFESVMVGDADQAKQLAFELAMAS